jgi:hypothetical protein
MFGHRGADRAYSLNDHATEDAIQGVHHSTIHRIEP